jgi:KRAB domain-containing zinc finger protein
VCDKTFNYKSSLKKHQLVHSGQRPYACDVCKSTFSKKFDMKTHQLIHSG